MQILVIGSRLLNNIATKMSNIVCKYRYEGGNGHLVVGNYVCLPQERLKSRERMNKIAFCSRYNMPPVILKEFFDVLPLGTFQTRCPLYLIHAFWIKTRPQPTSRYVRRNYVNHHLIHIILESSFVLEYLIRQQKILKKKKKKTSIKNKFTNLNMKKKLAIINGCLHTIQFIVTILTYTD